MTQKSGKVTGKTSKYGLLGKKKFYVKVKFDQSYDRMGTSSYNYQVDKDLFESIIVGAMVTGQFAQVPEGLRPLFLC